MSRTCKKNGSKRIITGHDTCVYTSKNKTRSGTYTGHFKNGKYDGKGKYVWKHDGSTYLGEWKDNLFDGKGTFRGADGQILGKNWKKNKMTGPGKRIYLVEDPDSKPMTQIESGTYKNGDLNGKCKMVFYNGVFDGVCKNDARTRGTYKYKNGMSVSGKWKKTNQYGKCKIQYSDGVIYEGEATKGIPSGMGKYTWKDGTIIRGSWREDPNYLHGKCNIEYPSGSKYAGECKDSEPNGEGILRKKDGAVLSGSWKNSFLNGYCTIKDKKGTYRGLCKNDKPVSKTIKNKK